MQFHRREIQPNLLFVGLYFILGRQPEQVVIPLLLSVLHMSVPRAIWMKVRSLTSLKTQTLLELLKIEWFVDLPTTLIISSNLAKIYHCSEASSLWTLLLLWRWLFQPGIPNTTKYDGHLPQLQSRYPFVLSLSCKVQGKQAKEYQTLSGVSPQLGRRQDKQPQEWGWIKAPDCLECVWWGNSQQSQKSLPRELLQTRDE